jgi:hypothetical protein
MDEVVNLTTKDLIDLSAICRMLVRTTGIQPDRSQLERIKNANQLKGNELSRVVNAISEDPDTGWFGHLATGGDQQSGRSTPSSVLQAKDKPVD